MTLKEAQHRAENVWGPEVRVQVIPAVCAVFMPSQEGQPVMVGGGDTWDHAITHTKGTYEQWKKEQEAKGVKFAPKDGSA